LGWKRILLEFGEKSMARLASWTFCAALGAVLMTGTALADDDTIQSLMADCGGPSVAKDDIDPCLERARELSETAPSPLLQGLTARLERRQQALDDAEQAASSGKSDPPPPSTNGPGGGAPTTTTASVAAPHA
jgi:hypothetical protein